MAVADGQAVSWGIWKLSTCSLDPDPGLYSSLGPKCGFLPWWQAGSASRLTALSSLLEMGDTRPPGGPPTSQRRPGLGQKALAGLPLIASLA